MFGAVLHWFPTPAEYEALTIYELDEFRSVVHEINGSR